MTSSLTSWWMKFFKDAGIQNNISAVLYATTFVENEIQADMVGDLNRDILREMGITLMGHVLAILKHANNVHNETEKDKIVAKTTYPTPSKTVSPFAQTSSEGALLKRSINEPAIRLIEQYVRPKEDIAAPQTKKTIIAGPSKKCTSTKMCNNTTTIQAKSVPKLGTPLKVTDRLGLKNAGSGIKRTTAFKTMNNEVVPVKRNRRVLPEEEGAYKITMPLGTTPKTKQLLAKKGNKATVFQRLGISDSSGVSDDRKVTITGLSEPTVKAGGSVFARLGGRQTTDVTPSCTVTSAQPNQGQLGYHGVLKTVASPSKTTVLVSPTTGKPSAKSRLGLAAASATLSQSLGSGLTRTITKKKKFILIKKSGQREIVYRDVVEGAPKCTTFDSATRNKFRSGNIAVLPGMSSRLGHEAEEQEWDY